MNPKVDFYFVKNTRWQAEITQLRKLVLGCNLTEELKWGVPCYTTGKANIVLIHVFKEYCALLFFKGALLADTEKLLVQQTENVQSARQLRFTDNIEVANKAAVIKAYIHEAIALEKAGLKVAFKKSSELILTEEFQKQLAANPALKAAFNALTPGRQRAYHLYFSAPKQAKTREGRVEKSIQFILDGKGLSD